MNAYILGAGASVNAGYPLASQLLHGLSAWLDRCDPSVHWVPWARNRTVQVRETFGSLDDFEGILGKLEDYGHERVKPPGLFFTTVPNSLEVSTSTIPACLPRAFTRKYLRSDLIGAFREFFYQVEELRVEPNAYDR